MSRRTQKVAALLEEQLAEMIRRALPEELGFVTITAVEVSADMKNAVVFYSCFEGSHQKEIEKRLETEKLEIQQLLGKRLEMRYTPKLEFRLDKGLEKVNRVEEILKDIKKS